MLSPILNWSDRAIDLEGVNRTLSTLVVHVVAVVVALRTIARITLLLVVASCRILL